MICQDDYEHPDENLIYIVENIPTNETEDLFNEHFSSGCSCEGFCFDISTCSCLQKSGAKYSKIEVGDVSTRQTNCALEVVNKDKPIYECNSNCKCFGEQCGNRVVQFGPRLNLEIINCETLNHTTIKGLGLRTKEDIRKNNYVCEYAGEVITQEESESRYKANKNQKAMNYILCVKERFGSKTSETIVDPTKFGNIGRYLNHSCNPNCEIIPVRINSIVPKLCIFTKKDIKSGSELTFDYGDGNLGFPLTDDMTDKKLCLCQEENCRIYMPFNK